MSIFSKGEPDFSPAPTICYHYSTLFDETGFWRWRLVEWKKELPQDFLKHGYFSPTNLAILFPEDLEGQIHRLTEDKPVQYLLPYNENRYKNELLAYAYHPYYRIMRYFDGDPQRGQIFGPDVWLQV